MEIIILLFSILYLVKVVLKNDKPFEMWEAESVGSNEDAIIIISPDRTLDIPESMLNSEVYQKYLISEYYQEPMSINTYYYANTTECTITTKDYIVFIAEDAGYPIAMSVASHDYTFYTEIR